MRHENGFAERLREWSHRPPTVTAEHAAIRLRGRLMAQAPPPRSGPLRPLLATAAAAALLLAGVTLLRGPAPVRPQPRRTTAAIVLSSGTQVVIDLGEVQP